MTGADCPRVADAYLNDLPPVHPTQARLTDKWVDNFEHLGLIHACLPNATIVHCRREPQDACLSMFGAPASG
jgi:hypothetical protein